MDIFTCSSRGKGLNLSNKVVKKGGNIHKLVDLGLGLMREQGGRRLSGPSVIYVVGGLPDVTERILDYDYEEVIFNETPDEAMFRLTKVYLEASTKNYMQRRSSLFRYSDNHEFGGVEPHTTKYTPHHFTPNTFSALRLYAAPSKFHHIHTQ